MPISKCVIDFSSVSQKIFHGESSGEVDKERFGVVEAKTYQVTMSPDQQITTAYIVGMFSKLGNVSSGRSRRDHGPFELSGVPKKYIPLFLEATKVLEARHNSDE